MKEEEIVHVEKDSWWSAYYFKFIGRQTFWRIYRGLVGHYDMKLDVSDNMVVVSKLMTKLRSQNLKVELVQHQDKFMFLVQESREGGEKRTVLHFVDLSSESVIGRLTPEYSLCDGDTANFKIVNCHRCPLKYLN